MDRAQLEQCINDYGKDIYAFCSRMTPNRQEAEELYQDTFLKAVELRSKIDFGNNPKSYLVSVAMRLWKNRKRKYAWRSRIAGTQRLVEEEANGEAENAEACGHGNPVEEDYLDRELRKQVRDAVADLDERYRIPVYLYYTMQLQVSEIAELMKIPEGTVKNRLHKARNMLKQKLEVVLDETEYGSNITTGPFSGKRTGQTVKSAYLAKSGGGGSNEQKEQKKNIGSGDCSGSCTDARFYRGVCGLELYDTGRSGTGI